MLNLLIGQYRSQARPTTEDLAMGPKMRESCEASRWSPSTNSCPSGTRQLAVPFSGVEGWPCYTYGSVSWTPFTNTA